MNEISKQRKKELKQFALSNKEEYIIYLQNIIAIAVKAMETHKKYVKELEDIIACYQVGEKIPHDVYSDIQNKISNVECYLLNLFGDGQTSSISYFKFRKMIIKAKKNLDIEFNVMSEEENEILNEFNKSRNWNNHIPESLLTAEIEMIKEGKAYGHSKNPIEVNFNNYVSYEYIMDLLKASLSFYVRAKIMLQSAKRDYSLLIGESVRIVKRYRDTPRDIKDMSATKLSAKIQGLTINDED